MIPPKPGQRWVSDSEPELGLGVVTEVKGESLRILFPATDAERQYSWRTAPLRRVHFKLEDEIPLRDGTKLRIDEIETHDGLFIYHGDDRSVSETELSDAIAFSKPEDRLLAGVVDDPVTFNLRLEANFRRSQIRQSPVRGLVGGRVDLIAHQLYIANEVAGRLLPRVLLADEVGLGKTVEAGMILHRLHLTGRADRILILVPEPLVNQWFVEILRKFNLRFNLFDEERCEAIETNDAAGNPFLENQLILCSIELLTQNPVRATQAAEAGWDLVIVDEAHHLEWTPESASPQYAVVESLARKVPGLLLLTATPQQLGPEGNFARLRLLDPDRYADLIKFTEETAHYEQVARAMDRILAHQPLNKTDMAMFSKPSPHVLELANALAAGQEQARPKLISALLDEFGTGRVTFRNTRNALSGFPARKLILAALPAGSADDPFIVQIKWLAGLLRKLHGRKILLICQTKSLTAEIKEALQGEIVVNAAVFHEGLSLLQRDRQAAYFAEEDGAQILLCSEIGSEGRNFQFAHHLVLFDLPMNPDLLEQRIGRLDRIGQSSTIHIHVPYLRGTASETLALWYHEGLNAFQERLHGGAEIAREVSDTLQLAMESPADPKLLANLTAQSRKASARTGKQLARGHDRLLELNSCDTAKAHALIDHIRRLDNDLAFEKFFLRVVEHFGITVAALDHGSYVLHPGELQTDAFPALPAEGATVTFNRTLALSREDWEFLTWDHPLVRGALDLLLGTEQGNASFAVWPGSGRETLLLECCFVAECVAPPALHADRFLAATPIRIVVDQALENFSKDENLIRARLKVGEIGPLLESGTLRSTLLPRMMEKVRELASRRVSTLSQKAAARMSAELGEEISRLESLRLRNNHIKPQEISALVEQRQRLHAAISEAQVRLDAVRLIACR